MPVIDNKGVPETPWRPNYREWDITRPGDGTTSSLSYSEAAPGAGAPLHVHEMDELIVVLEGRLEARLGDEVAEAGPDHTLVIPPGLPHGFTVLGPELAKFLIFFPVPDPFARTTYLEGSPPGK